MTIEERKEQSVTRVFKTVFPDLVNHHNTMFGGKVMLMMTETAFMTATRFCRKRFVIAAADGIEFLRPIPFAALIELVGRVEETGVTSLKVKVEVYTEKMEEAFREKAVSGWFTLVAIGQDNRPVKIFG